MGGELMGKNRSVSEEFLNDVARLLDFIDLSNLPESDSIRTQAEIVEDHLREKIKKIDARQKWQRDNALTARNS